MLMAQLMRAANPAIVSDTSFKNLLREPLAIYVLSPFQAHLNASRSSTKLYSCQSLRSNSSACSPDGSENQSAGVQGGA